MLRATRRLLRPGGRTAFLTIHEAPGLDPAERRRARRAGPRALAARAPQRRLVEAAGFVDVEEVDVTPAFLATARAWLGESAARAAALAVLEAPEAFEQRQADRAAMVAAIEAGLLRRTLFVARRRPHRY